MLRLLTLTLYCLAIAFPQASAAQPLKVVTSIQPLQMIANQVMRGSTEAGVLIASSQSPHHFQLKPSQLRKLQDVDLLVWISNDFETGLNKLQRILAAGSSQLQLIRHFPPEQLIGSGHHDVDGHLWLAPENVITIAQLLADRLGELDPPGAPLYQRNATELRAELQLWQQRSQQQLDALEPRYILDHRFLNYFERSFALSHTASLRSQHDHAGSMRSLSQIHQQLQSTPVACLLVSSLPLSKQAEEISQRYQLRVEVMHILNEDGAALSIHDLLDSMVTALLNCR